MSNYTDIFQDANDYHPLAPLDNMVMEQMTGYAQVTATVSPKDNDGDQEVKATLTFHNIREHGWCIDFYFFSSDVRNFLEAHAPKVDIRRWSDFILTYCIHNLHQGRVRK